MGPPGSHSKFFLCMTSKVHLDLQTTHPTFACLLHDLLVNLLLCCFQYLRTLTSPSLLKVFPTIDATSSSVRATLFSPDHASMWARAQGPKSGQKKHSHYVCMGTEPQHLQSLRQRLNKHCRIVGVCEHGVCQSPGTVNGEQTIGKNRNDMTHPDMWLSCDKTHKRTEATVLERQRY